MRALILVCLALLPFAPLASAGEHGPGPDEHVRLLAEGEIDGEHYYVLEDHGAILVYRETNGVRFGGVDDSGVQPAWSCVEGATLIYVWPDEECARGVRVAPDERVTNGAILHEVIELLPEEIHDVVDGLLP